MYQFLTISCKNAKQKLDLLRTVMESPSATTLSPGSNPTHKRISLKRFYLLYFWWNGMVLRSHIVDPVEREVNQ